MHKQNGLARSMLVGTHFANMNLDTNVAVREEFFSMYGSRSWQWKSGQKDSYGDFRHNAETSSQ